MEDLTLRRCVPGELHFVRVRLNSQCGGNAEMNLSSSMYATYAEPDFETFHLHVIGQQKSIQLYSIHVCFLRMDDGVYY